MSWNPMETAPKDRRILLRVPYPTEVLVEIGCYRDDRHSKYPRPYWSRCPRISEDRSYPPNGWRELPSTEDSFDHILNLGDGRLVMMQAPPSITREELDRLQGWLGLQLLISDSEEEAS